MFPNAHGVSSTTMQTPTPGEARFASKLTCTLVSYSLIPSASSQPAAGGAVLAATGQPERFTWNY